MDVGSVWIGTSGYAYGHWRGVLYEPGLPRERWLARYAECFDTVELNATFYGLPSREAVQRWREQVPADFLFAAKMSRYGTHLRRLREPADWLQRFLDVLEPLGPQLGPILVQLPPRWDRDVGRLAGFLDALPAGRRVAMEFRDPDWLHDSVFEALRAHGVALCIHDLVRQHPQVVTAGWVYLRFHGPSLERRYTGHYPARALDRMAATIRSYAEAGLDVYAYFDNDGAGAAVIDARRLQGMLGIAPAGGRTGRRPAGTPHER